MPQISIDITCSRPLTSHLKQLTIYDLEKYLSDLRLRRTEERMGCCIESGVSAGWQFFVHVNQRFAAIATMHLASEIKIYFALRHLNHNN